MVESDINNLYLQIATQMGPQLALVNSAAKVLSGNGWNYSVYSADDQTILHFWINPDHGFNFNMCNNAVQQAAAVI